MISETTNSTAVWTDGLCL